MPAPEYTGREQKAVLWVYLRADNRGEVIVASPIELDVQWDATRSVSTDPATGDPVTLDAGVVVDQDVPLLSVMALGTLEQWYGTGSAEAIVELFQVRTSVKAPDVKAREFYRDLGLVRYRRELPELG